MINFRKNYAMAGAAFTLGALVSQPAQAQLTAVTAGGGSTDASGFTMVFDKIVTSFGGITGLISMFAYVLGIILLIGGILKIKDHVENPGQTDLKTGVIRVIIGGALFALPAVIDYATSTIGDQKQDTSMTTLKKGTFGFAS